MAKLFMVVASVLAICWAALFCFVIDPFVFYLGNPGVLVKLSAAERVELGKSIMPLVAVACIPLVVVDLFWVIRAVRRRAEE